jgi:small subunit ribosomal protein S8
MSMNDVLSDSLTRVRNGQRAHLATVRCHHSKLVANVMDVLKREGYIRDYQPIEVKKGIIEIEVELKYFEGEPVIKELKRVSTPGRRTYTSIDTMPKHYNGLGITVISTSKGVMSDYEARQAHVGGEVLCSVF